MKKIYCFIILTALALGCSKSGESCHELTEAVGGVISLSSDTSLENEPEAKSGTVNQTLRYVVEAWTVGENSVCAFRKEFEGSSADAKTEIMLVPGEYDLLFWADYGSGDYITDNLTEVKRVIPDSGVVSPEAFAYVLENVRWDGKGIGVVKLIRPVSKLAVLGKNKFTEQKKVKITYSNLPTVYNVRTRAASDERTFIVNYPNTSVESNVAAEDILFVPAESASKVGMKITVGNVTKSLDEVPLRPNYKVNVTATF